MAFRSLLIPLLFASLFLSFVSPDDSVENEAEDISYFFESTLTLHNFPKSKNGYYSDFQYLTAKPLKNCTAEPLDDRNARLRFFMEKPDPNVNRLYQITAQYTGKSEQIQLYLCAKRNKRACKSPPKNQKYLLVGSLKFLTEEQLTARCPHCFVLGKMDDLNNNRYFTYNAYDYNEALEEGREGKLVQYFRVETKTKYIVYRAVKEGEEGNLHPNPIQRFTPFPPRVSEGNTFFRESYYLTFEPELSAPVLLYKFTTKETDTPMNLYFQKRKGEVLYQIVGRHKEESKSSSSSYATSKPHGLSYSNVYICRLKVKKQFRYILVTPIHGRIQKDPLYPTDCFRLGKLENDDMNRFVAYGHYKKKEEIPAEEYTIIKLETKDTYQPIYFSLLHRGESSQAARPVETLHRRH